VEHSLESGSLPTQQIAEESAPWILEASAMLMAFACGGVCMADRAALLSWCTAEKENLRNELAQIELSVDRAQRVGEVKLIEKHLADLAIVLHNLKAQAGTVDPPPKCESPSSPVSDIRLEPAPGLVANLIPSERAGREIDQTHEPLAAYMTRHASSLLLAGGVAFIFGVGLGALQSPARSSALMWSLALAAAGIVMVAVGMVMHVESARSRRARRRRGRTNAPLQPGESSSLYSSVTGSI